MIQTAEKIQRKFSVLLGLFSQCHNIYSQCAITDEDIACLGKFNSRAKNRSLVLSSTDTTHIPIFMKYYREQFPHVPKMHMLESHVVEWLYERKVGLGLMGEQGAESIHAYFNNLKTSYRNIPNGVERLRCMMKHHFVHIAPSNIMCRPPPVKRQKKSKI